MAGLLVYILISLLIYFVTVDWPWIVFSAAAFLAFFAGYATLTRRQHAHIPDDDARLLPWIDATGPYIPRIWADAAQKAWDLMEEGRQRPLPETGEVFNIPLLDGGIVDTSSCFDDAARRACASQAPAAEIQGYLRLLNCLAHDDDVRCEACGDDPI